MHPPYQIPVWKLAPTIRLLAPLILGIILQWYLQFSFSFIIISLVCFGCAIFLFKFLPLSILFSWKKLQAVCLLMMVLTVGSCITWMKDSRHNSSWYGWHMTDSSRLVLKINEPLVPKPRSIKAEAQVLGLMNGKTFHKLSGKLLLYFAKDSILPNLKYGEIILVDKPLQAIKNSGNPGGFNYRRYAAFQQIFHQLFLKRKDWVSTQQFSRNAFQQFLFDARSRVLEVLRHYVHNEQQQLGIAEALLIGYKEDLDKDLVQAYSNTGVVHIIAISGLHLGLIYAVLLWLCNKIPGLKRSRHAKTILIISCLWLFALLTGGAASVLRSAVMFTLILVGKYYFRQSSIYNSLAASAFLLLLYNPYLLWDVGFQLSYCAVIGIVAFQKYIYRSWYPPNKVLKWIWSMTSITLAAQLGTFPVCIYYFHQFPTMFLFTNLVAVPVSTAILFAEILLLVFAPVNFIAAAIGWLISFCIAQMNNLILFFNKLPYAVLDFLYASIFSTWLWYAVITGTMFWLMDRKKNWLKFASLSFMALVFVYAFAYYQQQEEKKIVIYNISRHSAIDFVYKGSYLFVGDTALREPGLLQNFHLKPARISMQASREKFVLPQTKMRGNDYEFFNQRICWISGDSVPDLNRISTNTAILLISNNAPVDIKQIAEAGRPAVIVFDGTNSLWKIQKWKKECEELLLRCHSVSEQGAFVLEIE